MEADPVGNLRGFLDADSQAAVRLADTQPSKSFNETVLRSSAASILAVGRADDTDAVLFPGPWPG